MTYYNGGIGFVFIGILEPVFIGFIFLQDQYR
jgi:hypothetical protein